MNARSLAAGQAVREPFTKHKEDVGIAGLVYAGPVPMRERLDQVILPAWLTILARNWQRRS